QWKHMIRPENTYRKRIFTGRPHLSRTIRDNAFNRNKEQDHMPIYSKYVFVASMDVDLDKEDLFNEVYDTEHIPNLLNVSGVHSATRVKGEPFALSIGGGKTNIPHEGARYSAVYEIDGPHVLVSPEWAKAGEAGRWPDRLTCSRIRPTRRARE